MDIETGVMLDRSDFAGFGWVFDMHGTLERLLEMVVRDEKREPEPRLRREGRS